MHGIFYYYSYPPLSQRVIYRMANKKENRVKSRNQQLRLVEKDVEISGCGEIEKKKKTLESKVFLWDIQTHEHINITRYTFFTIKKI